MSPTIYRSRPVALGQLGVHFISNDDSVVDRFDILYKAFETLASAEPRIEVVITRSGDGFTTAIAGQALVPSPDLKAQELAITRDLNRKKLAAEPDLLHLHGAAASRDGRAVMIVGRSHHGKSTLAAYLAKTGWDYITDEQVTIRPTDSELLPYPRPITLRRPVWKYFGDVAGVPLPSPSGNPSDQAEISPFALGSVHRGGSLQVAAILSPNRGAEPRLLRDHHGAAHVVELLSSNCLDLDRIGLPGFVELVKMASRCPAAVVNTNDLVTAAHYCDEFLMTSNTFSPISWTYHPPITDETPLLPGSVRRMPGVHSWEFEDGSTIIYRPETRRIATLDGVGAQIWPLLDVPCKLTDLDLPDAGSAAADNHSLATWVSNLSHSGLLQLTQQ